MTGAESFIRISTAIVRERCQTIINNPIKDFFGRTIEHSSAKTFIKMCDLAEQSGEDTIYMTKSDIETVF